jgi:ketosteroid isomerase-like protein
MDPGAHRPLEIVESCFAAIEAQDADRLAAHYTDDYVLELPYWKPEEPLVIEGREAAHAYLVTLLAVQHMRLEITTDRWIPQEDLLIAEYTSRGEFLDTGEPYQNSYVGYWFFAGERIRRLREYYNPQAPRASALD